MKILFIRPIITNRPDHLEEEILKKYASKGVEISACHLDYGPSSIENEYDLCFSAPFVVKEAVKWQKRGFDGIISYCFANPGVDACREALEIPCLGSGEAAIALAALIGRKIGIITILPNILPLIKKQNAEYIRMGKIVSVRYANVPVTEINNNKDFVLESLYKEAVMSVQKEGSDTIVLGCTGFAGYAKEIQNRLYRNGFKVSVVDPAIASLKMMEALIVCNVRHSKITYMNPIDKLMVLP